MTTHVELFVRTYDHDAKWLRYCLASITKYARGYAGLTIVYEPGSAEAPNVTREWRTKKGHRFLPQVREAVDNDGWPMRGYLHQQYSKMRPDMFVNHERITHICHIDSDCVFLVKHTPEVYFDPDGNVRLLMTPYETLPPEIPWRTSTPKVCGFTVPCEYMRRFPLVYPLAWYQFCRGWLQHRHGKDLATILKENPDMSEFNVMGAIAHHIHFPWIRWIDTITTPSEEWQWNLLRQKWSHAFGPNDKQEAEATVAGWESAEE